MNDAGTSAPSGEAVRALHRRMARGLFSHPVAIGDLAIGGDDLRRAGIPAGPIYAKILHVLLEKAIEDPARNTPEALLAELPHVVAALQGTLSSAKH